MSLCGCYIDDSDGYFEKKGKPKLFNLKCRKRCLNCNRLINKGEECQAIENYNFDEYCEKVYEADTYLCEECNDLTLALEEMKGFYTLGVITLQEQFLLAKE